MERCFKTLTVLMFFIGLCGGCDRGPSEPGGPDEPPPLALLSVAPATGSTVGTTAARLFGTGFGRGMTVTVGSALVVEYTLVNSSVIDLIAPAHAAGVVDIVLTKSNEVSRLAGAYTYIDYPPPVVTNITPTRLSTQGSVLYIKGTGFNSSTSVTIDGTRVSVFFYDDTLFTSAPPHAAGAVDIVVTNSDGQAVRLAGALTFAPPESFDLNGDWVGGADNGSHEETVIRFTIRNNVMVSLACGAGADLLPTPAPTAAGGQISSAGASITGRITSEGEAQGSINIPPCAAHVWSASKR